MTKTLTISTPTSQRESFVARLFAAIAPRVPSPPTAPAASLLDQILAAQGPMRREIRARDKRRERDRPEGSTTSRQVHAQIISLAA